MNEFALLNDNKKIRISYLSGKSRIEENKNTFNVFTKKLDDYLKNRNKPTILKLDTEGSENLILNGGINFFKKYNPKVFIEIWAKNVKGVENSYKAINLIKKLGYQSYLINDDFTIRKVNFDIPEYLHKIKQSTENVLFMKSKF